MQEFNHEKMAADLFRSLAKIYRATPKISQLHPEQQDELVRTLQVLSRETRGLTECTWLSFAEKDEKFVEALRRFLKRCLSLIERS